MLLLNLLHFRIDHDKLTIMDYVSVVNEISLPLGILQSEILQRFLISIVILKVVGTRRVPFLKVVGILRMPFLKVVGVLRVP